MTQNLGKHFRISYTKKISFERCLTDYLKNKKNKNKTKLKNIFAANV